MLKQLVDTLGRMIWTDKRVAIPLNLPKIFERLLIDRQLGCDKVSSLKNFAPHDLLKSGEP